VLLPASAIILRDSGGRKEGQFQTKNVFRQGNSQQIPDINPAMPSRP